AFQTIEAEHFEYVRGIYVERSDDTTAVVGNTASGYYTAYNNVDFGNRQPAGITLLAQNSNRSAQPVEVRLGSPSGQLLSTLSVPVTGSTNWVNASGEVAGVDGRQNIYLVYKSASLKVDNFRFYDDSSTGITLPELSPRMALSPNPAVNSLRVDFPHAGHLTVYNLTGSRVFSTEILPGVTTLDVSGYAPGACIVEIASEAGKTHAIFIKR
ncbi:MAG: carbohydrate-binding protein, partial [Tannerella sp.]|nr:carbohydrate-binding protein [Tannerella sp.]